MRLFFKIVSRIGTRAKAEHLNFTNFIETLPARSDLHLARKIWHLGAGLIVASSYQFEFTQTFMSIVVGTFFTLSVLVEFFRLRNPVMNEICVRFMSPFIRTHEVNSTSGMPYYAASCLLSILIFPKPIAILAILFLAFGDPIASTVGILTKKRSIQIIPGKSFQGTAAAYLVCGMITWFYLKSTGMQGLDLIRLTLLGGFAGATSEFLPFEIDDNFTIPMVSGFVMWLGFILIHFA